VAPNTTGEGRPFFNAAAFCHRGRVASLARKCLLPTYDVFDEDRYFEPATRAHRDRTRWASASVSRSARTSGRIR
jgi:predicted amidohydrolase